MRNVFAIFCLILGSKAEIYLGKSSDDTKGCNSSDELVTYDDIFGDTDIEQAIRNLLETDKSGSAWISGYPRYSPYLTYRGCYKISCRRYATRLLQKYFDLSDDRTLFRCAEDCFTVNYSSLAYIGISHKRCFCLTSVHKECAVNSSFCDDDREKLYRRVKIPELDASVSEIISVLAYINFYSSITDVDRKKPCFNECTYYAPLKGFQYMNGPCDLGQGFICSNSLPSDQCLHMSESESQYFFVTKNKSSLLEAEMYCHRYWGVLSMSPPQLGWSFPTSMFLLSAFREFVISDEVNSTDKDQCVYAYVGKSDRAIRIGSQACSSKLLSLCKVQVSSSHGKEVSEDTTVGVSMSTSHGKNVSDDTIVGVSTCIGLLTCLIVLVFMVVIWKRRHTTRQQREARIARALQPHQCDEECEIHDCVSPARDEDCEAVYNE